MSIEKSISPTLSNLIAEANYTIQNTSEKILAVYTYAVNNDGYTPEEARSLVEKKIVNVTNRYIRKVLPDEAKATKFTPKHLISNVELVPPTTTTRTENEDFMENEDFKEFRDTYKLPPIPSAYDIKEADSVEIIGEDHNWTSDKIKKSKEIDIPNEIPQHIILQLQEVETIKQQNKEFLVKINELETKLQDKSFDLINMDTIKNGVYDLEIKDRIIPLKWNFNLSTDKIVIMLDTERARRMGI